MTAIRTHTATKYASDHFEPQENNDPQAQRRLRGQLEQIDYAAFASNKEVIAQLLGEIDPARFQRLAVSAAAARAKWVAEAMAMADQGLPAAAQIARLAEMRQAFEELTAAYEALRRMVERGYVGYRPPAG